MVAHQTGGLGVASSSLVTPTKKSRILIGILLFLCNQQDLNLRTSFQTASRYGAAVWEKPPAEVLIMSGNQSHSDQEKQDTDWYPAFFMQSARLELANEFPNGKPVRRDCLGETSGGVFQCSFTPAMIFFTLISFSFINIYP